MNKLILCIFVVLAALVINVRWSTGSLNSLLDDFVSYPSLKVKRDLEFEEFVKDGDMKAAKKRALHRQKRMNEENMSDTLKRFRRNLREAEEEEEDHDVESRCSADEYNGIERGTCHVCASFQTKIKWYIKKLGPAACSETTAARFSETISLYNGFSDCTFEMTEVAGVEEAAEAEADLVIVCDPNGGNVAPLGKNPSNKNLNVQEINGGKAGYKIITHELGHVCCLQHTQKLKGRSQVVRVNSECIQPGMESQFTEDECVNTCSLYEKYPILLLNVASVMQYKATDFKADNCATVIVPLHSSFATLNARKELYIPELSLIREARCKYCESDVPLTDDEIFGKGCETILSMTDIVEADEVELDGISTLCLQPTTTRVDCGKNVKVKCPSGATNVVLSKLSWRDIPERTNCKSDVMRVVAKQGGNLGEMAIMCGNGDDDTIDYIFECENDSIVFDANDCSGGYTVAYMAAC